jgi:AcrR family transcriptional regulator
VKGTPTSTRRYDSPVRRERAAETRERIIAAGAEILHAHAVWNWSALTIRDVAQRAGVNERTVYRHFAGEAELREAVMARLEQEAGVALEDLRLDDLQQFTARLLGYVSSFPLDPRTTRDPTLMAAHDRMRDALLAAVEGGSDDWPVRDRTVAAALLDVLWSVSSYERLVADWGLAPQEAIDAVTWVIGLVEDAIRTDRRPPGAGMDEEPR